MEREALTTPPDQESKRPAALPVRDQLSTAMNTPKSEMKVPTFHIDTTSWSTKKAKLQARYSQLTDADLNLISGHENELVNRLQKKLGKSEAEVQKFLKEI